MTTNQSIENATKNVQSEGRGLCRVLAVGVLLAAEEAAWAAPYEISKFKLLVALDNAGLFDDVWAFINADPKRRILWDAATCLDSDDPMIAEAVSALMTSTGLPFEQVDAIMRSARRVGI
jgi:hypothetical protein